MGRLDPEKVTYGNWGRSAIARPNSPELFAQSGEGLWQGLKVFEQQDIDPSRWEITNLRGIKRAGRARGKVLGHDSESEAACCSATEKPATTSTCRPIAGSWKTAWRPRSSGSGTRWPGG